MSSQLADIQQRFADALLDPGHMHQVLAEFSGDADRNRERFAFYRGNLRGNWEQACASAYPVLKQLVGAAFFSELTQAYGNRHASQSGDLHGFGGVMGDFLATLDSCGDYPYLPDVARLEWQIHQTYYQQLAPAALVSDLAAINPSRVGSVTLTLQPACALFHSRWSVADIWHAHQSAQPVLPTLLDRPCHCLIWRAPNDWAVQVDQIDAARFAGLESLRSGQPLGEMVGAALAVDPQFDLQSALRDWFDKHLIVSISMEQS